jgi:hypothetical protein
MCFACSCWKCITRRLDAILRKDERMFCFRVGVACVSAHSLLVSSSYYLIVIVMGARLGLANR